MNRQSLWPRTTPTKARPRTGGSNSGYGEINELFRHIPLDLARRSGGDRARNGLDRHRAARHGFEETGAVDCCRGPCPCDRIVGDAPVARPVWLLARSWACHAGSLFCGLRGRLVAARTRGLARRGPGLSRRFEAPPIEPDKPMT